MEQRKYILLNMHPDKASINKLTDKQKEQKEEELKRIITSFKFIKDYLIEKKLDVDVPDEEQWEEYFVLEKIPISEYQEKVWLDHNKVYN